MFRSIHCRPCPCAFNEGRNSRANLRATLPPYSPELDPAEYLNNDVKGNAERGGRARIETDWHTQCGRT